MLAYDIALGVALVIDRMCGRAIVVPLVRSRKRSLVSRDVTAVDTHIAFIRAVYEMLPAADAYRLVSSEPMSVRTLAHRIIEAAHRCEVRSAEEHDRWKKSDACYGLILKTYRTFLDGLRNGFDTQRRDLEHQNEVLSHTVQLLKDGLEKNASSRRELEDRLQEVLAVYETLCRKIEGENSLDVNRLPPFGTTKPSRLN